LYFDRKYKIKSSIHDSRDLKIGCDRIEDDKVPVYFDGMHYDAWTEREVDIPFYLDQVAEYGEPVLELGCGTGRITIPIAEEGWDIVGLDVSERFLKHAREKAQEEDLEIDWMRGDMRDFSLDEKFSLIIVPFNTIHHILELDGLERVLNNVKRHLKEDGRFIVEFFNPDLDILNRNPDDEHEILSYELPEKGEIVVREKTNYRKADQLMHITWIFDSEEKEFFKEWIARVYFPKEVDTILNYNGFLIEEKYGDFDASPFTNNSGQQIVVCKVE